MKFPTVYILVLTLVPSIRAQCECYHNNDAARWVDSESPASRLNILCFSGGGCYQAEVGNMCVIGDVGNQCGCAVSAAANWQSLHDDWFLWSAITCDGLSITIT